MIRRSTDFEPRHAISRARFFLERAEECNVDERDEFEANLEAAIIFGRTAMDRLNRKYRKYRKKLGKHEEWWNNQLKDRSVKFFMEERHWILHEGPPKVGQKIIGAGIGERSPAESVTRASELYYFDEDGPQTPATVTVGRH